MLVGLTPVTVHVDDGLAVKHDPAPEVAPVIVTTHVVPGGFDTGLQVKTTVTSTGSSLSPVVPHLVPVPPSLFWEDPPPWVLVFCVWHCVPPPAVPPRVPHFVPGPPRCERVRRPVASATGGVDAPLPDQSSVNGAWLGSFFDSHHFVGGQPLLESRVDVDAPFLGPPDPPKRGEHDVPPPLVPHLGPGPPSPWVAPLGTVPLCDPTGGTPPFWDPQVVPPFVLPVVGHLLPDPPSP